jgi:hypothetical protein
VFLSLFAFGAFLGSGLCAVVKSENYRIEAVVSKLHHLYKFFKEIFWPFMARIVRMPSTRVGLHLSWELHPLPSTRSGSQIWSRSFIIRV